MSEKHYYIHKNNNEKEIVYIDYDKFKGYDFIPKKGMNYEGVIVNKMVIVNPSMIKKVLQRKIQKKLELYLKLIINFMNSDDSDSSSTLREALNDLTRYKNIVAFKYQKYLDEKYLRILTKKIEMIEFELASKLISIEEYDYEKEEVNHRRR